MGCVQETKWINYGTSGGVKDLHKVTLACHGSEPCKSTFDCSRC